VGRGKSAVWGKSVHFLGPLPSTPCLLKSGKGQNWGTAPKASVGGNRTCKKKVFDYSPLSRGVISSRGLGFAGMGDSVALRKSLGALAVERAMGKRRRLVSGETVFRNPALKSEHIHAQKGRSPLQERLFICFLVGGGKTGNGGGQTISIS